MNILDEIRTGLGAALEDTDLFFSEATLTRVSSDGDGWKEGNETATAYPCKAMVES